MCKYKIRVYEATQWSLLTQADHFQDYYIDSELPLSDLARKLSRDGFSSGDGRKWIMPGAILFVEIT